MKKSIGIKLFIGITFFALLIVILSWILNTSYLENYYLTKKKETLVEYGNEIEELYISEENEISLEVDKIENIINGDISIYTINGSVVESALTDQSGHGKGKNIGKGNFPLNNVEIQKVILGETVIDIYNHPRFNTKFLFLGTLLKNKNILIIQTPIASITESVEIAKSFHIYIGFFSLIIGTLVAFIFSRIFTKPIIELNNIARNMGKLDFSRKYKVKNLDEIGELGETINFLSDKLDVTINELNNANEKLKEDIEREKKIDIMRKEFIANVSHELKTPIALIKGYSEGLKDNVVDDEENKIFYCDVIMDESQKMERLVKELLDLSIIESGHLKLQIQNFNIYNLIEKIVNKYNQIFIEKNIIININAIDKDLMVTGDISRIEQVITNLLNNAINHVDNKKCININISDINSKIKIEIKNSGSTINKDEIKKIWDSFYKIDKSRTRKYGGTGLGLSIVKGILELHKSLFGVNNTEDGVLFWFELNKSI